MAIAAPRAPERGSRWPKKRSEAATTIERLSVFETAYVTGWIIDSVQNAISFERYCVSPVKPGRRTRAPPCRRGATPADARRDAPAPKYSITDATGASVRHDSAVSSAYVCRGVISGSESIDA